MTTKSLLQWAVMAKKHFYDPETPSGGDIVKALIRSVRRTKPSHGTEVEVKMVTSLVLHEQRRIESWLKHNKRNKKGNYYHV